MSDARPFRPLRILSLAQWFAAPGDWDYRLSFARGLARRGYCVEALSGFYNLYDGRKVPGPANKLWRTDVVDGISVTRVWSYHNHTKSGWKRFLSYGSFAVSAATFGLFGRSRPDVVVCYTFPTLSLPAFVFRSLLGAKIVVHVMDLWPDSVADSGMMKNRVLNWLLKRWSNAFYRSADALIVPTRGIQRALVERGIAPEKIFFTPNWTNESALVAAPVSKRDASDADQARPFTVLYAGNVGAAQALDVVLDAARLLERDGANVVFRLVGDGIDCERLKKRAETLATKSVVFAPRVPAAEIAREFDRADALLIHLKKTPLFKITVPSKTQAYLFVGKPILCGVEGDAAETVAEAGAGLPFEPENPADLARAVRELRAKSPQERAALGRSGAEYYRERLSLASACDRIAETTAFLFPERAPERGAKESER